MKQQLIALFLCVGIAFLVVSCDKQQSASSVSETANEQAHQQEIEQANKQAIDRIESLRKENIKRLNLESLYKKLAQSKTEEAEKLNRVNYVKQQVTYFWQQYQADVRDSATKTDYVEKINPDTGNSYAKDIYSKWLDEFTKESERLAHIQKTISELDSDIKEYQISGVATENMLAMGLENPSSTSSQSETDGLNILEIKEKIRRNNPGLYGNDSSGLNSTPRISYITQERAEKYLGPAAREEMRAYLISQGQPASESDINFCLKLNERLEHYGGN